MRISRVVTVMSGNLSRADLLGATLTAANLSSVIWTGATGNAVCPNGAQSPYPCA
jgi:uncharacterized protein YjbI with pentapeptide repeats